MNIRLQAMPQERFDRWLTTSQEQYLASRIAAGESETVAREKAERSFADNFPNRQPLATHRVWEVLDDDAAVGYIWIGPQPGLTDAWWIFDIEIEPAFRRRGFGRQAMLLGEVEARRLGAASVGLNVFGYNANARALYESLGYVTTAVQMRKDLTGA
ncbi:GNAT family N-acetyltransferase [Cryobacterium sp. CG_9.6]|uniref:GNAT family N-acetyltransferase n=1 Tax=Cryobacterium sp. CG_9.6 TaxID=2760710 RepID=UPI0024765B21|nr:GNAT family N-acetyltransferase [Cryobacterium sp. CG_9.6]MDH6236780.1 ribosomal protein S18 acetylase RimI-like enzyme [Cryobacterium sp. CG_9.6]